MSLPSRFFQKSSIWLFALLVVLFGAMVPVSAQQTTEDLSNVDWDAEETKEDLSNVDWDAEETEENLSNVDWDAEETEEDLSNVDWDTGGQSGDSDSARFTRRSSENISPFWVHLQGSLICFLYIMGLFVTIFFAGKSPISRKIVPEILILLHLLWPLEWLLILHYRRKEPIGQ